MTDPSKNSDSTGNSPSSADWVFSPYLVPAVFVLLWSTGFIGAKMGAPYAEPFTFLALRFAIVLVLFVPIIVFFVNERVAFSTLAHSMVSGIMIHGLYLGGVFYAIHHGMSAGVSALIVSLQPIITAAIAKFFLGERFGIVRTFWLFVGLAGAGMVILPKIGVDNSVENLSASNLVIVFGAALAISVGTVYQKVFVTRIDLRLSTMGQYMGALLFVGSMSFLLEEQKIEWSGEFIFALTWLVLVLSFGAVGMLMFMIRRDDVSSVASLFFLVPAVAALIAYYLFDEQLVPMQFAGMAVVMLAVAMSMRRAAKFAQKK